MKKKIHQSRIPGIPVKNDGEPPASMRRTDLEASSDSRLARTDPAEPPPTKKEEENLSRI